MSDLWNAMLHNDCVLCLRNTQEIIAGTVLNDKISHEVDRFKDLNKLEQTKTCELIFSIRYIEQLNSEKESIVQFSNFPIIYRNQKTITIMQHNYISEKLGNNGKPKRDADPAN